MENGKILWKNVENKKIDGKSFPYFSEYSGIYLIYSIERSAPEVQRKLKK